MEADMFSWGGCIIKLLLSVGVVCGMNGSGSMGIGSSIITGVLIYSMISAWWYFCCMMGNYIIGTVAFLAVVFVATWGLSSATNVVLKVISGIVIVAIAIGGAVYDIWGMITSILRKHTRS